MKIKPIFFEVDGKKVLVGEVEIFEFFNVPYNMVKPIEVVIENIKINRKEGDYIKLE